MSLKIAKLAAAALVAAGMSSGAALADGHSTGVYLGLAVSGSDLVDIRVTNGRGIGSSSEDGTSSGRVTNKYGFDRAYGGAIKVGYDWGPMRTEIEASRKEFDIDSVTQADGGKSTGVSGEAKATAYMLNFILDIDLGDDVPVTPYVMMGAGKFKGSGSVAYTGSGGAAGDKYDVSFSGSTYAGQIGAGLAVNVMDGTDITLGYSYMGAPREQTMRDWVEIQTFSAGVNYTF